MGPRRPVERADALGIDLGLKSFAALSDGRSIEAERFYRDLQPALAVAQRAGRKARVRAIHAKIANRRNDFLHKLSTELVQQHPAIYVGNVSAQALARTRLAKSVLDAGWSKYRTILGHKCDRAGVWFAEVNERHSTQDCHACGARAGPTGARDLSVRAWTCRACGATHDRDTNAAINIRDRGVVQWWLDHQRLSTAGEAKADEAVVNKVHARRAPRPGMAVQ